MAAAAASASWGFGLTPLNTRQVFPSPASPNARLNSANAADPVITGSVTTSGLRQPREASRSGSSAMVPGPNRTWVGNEKLAGAGGTLTGRAPRREFAGVACADYIKRLVRPGRMKRLTATGGAPSLGSVVTDSFLTSLPETGVAGFGALAPSPAAKASPFHD